MTGNLYWLASYPKSGNTWLRIFLGQLLGQTEAQDINQLALSDSISSSRYRFDQAIGMSAAELDHDTIDNLRPWVYEKWSSAAEKLQYVKAHDAYHLTAAGAPLFPAAATRGVIHIVRDPRDVALSLAHHLAKSVDEAIVFMANSEAYFAKGEKSLPPQLRQRLGDWSQHSQSWLECPLPVLTVRYEDMLADTLNTFTQIVQFAQIEADQTRIQATLEASRFSRLQALESQSRFIESPRKSERFFRKGQAGDWRENLTTAQTESIVAQHGTMMQQLGYLPD